MIAFRELRPTTERLYWQTTQALEGIEWGALGRNGWLFLDCFDNAELVEIDGGPVIYVNPDLVSTVLVLQRPWGIS